MAAINPDGAAENVYIPVDDDTATIEEGITEDNSISQILFWIGFTTADQRNAVQTDAIAKFADIKIMTEKDISLLATDFSNRAPAARRISIGARRGKLLKALVHWVQDFYRISEEPTIVGLNAKSFREALIDAITRSNVRQTLKDNSETAAKVANPGPLKSEKKWREWEEKFINYLTCIPGVNGIPIVYVIRSNEEPDRDTAHQNFVSRTIACAPLTGEFFLADCRTVFNLLLSFTTGEPSGDWIKSTVKYSDGRRSMQALRDHFAGEGNASRNKAVADALKKSLHYKSERAMPFEDFLTKCQRMFNIYEKEEEPMTEDAKLRFLYSSIHNPGLEAAVEALKVQRAVGLDISYTQAANHLSKAVSELPEYIAKNRSISALNADKSGRDGSASIYNEDGSIKTGHINGWNELPRSERDKVITERKRLGIKPGAWKNGKNKTWKRNGSNLNASDVNRLKQLTEQNKKYKRALKAVKRGRPEEGDPDDAEEGTDAGDTFGGKLSKKKAKTNN